MQGVRMAEKKKLVFLRNMIDTVLSFEDYMKERDEELSQLSADRLEQLYKQTEAMLGQTLQEAEVVSLLEEMLGKLQKEPAVKPKQMIPPNVWKEQEFCGETELFLPQEEKEAYMETTLLEERLCVPFLVRKKTKEKIFINRDVFRIGKERSCVDYYIENDAVSRSHANIIRKKDRFFLVDQDSLNHTFLEGKQILAKQYTRLESGQSFVLANEEFDFYYEPIGK